MAAGVREDGGSVDCAADDAWAERGGHAQEQVRREEVNINAPVHHGDTEREII